MRRNGRRSVRVRPPVRFRTVAAAPPAPAARTRPRVGVWRPTAVLTVIAVLCGAGILLYLDERSSRERVQVVGSAPAGDRLVVHVVLQRVDATADSLVAKVLPEPQGALAEPDGPNVPAQELVVETTSLEQAVIRAPAGQRIGFSTIVFPLTDGRISDYPFDRYRALLGFRATAGGRPVPVLLNLQESDPFFVLRQDAQEEQGGVVEVTERVSRSRSTFILAWFMIVAMWALGLSALAAAWLITRQRRGLVWPALGWMAATLFALVGMRNAAPGSPPIGSLLDYAAFYWAEVLVTVSLTLVVVRGARLESSGATT